jgi:hypothetical protein
MTIKKAWQIVESRNGLTLDDVIHGTKEDYKTAIELLLSKMKIMLVDGVYYSVATGVKLIKEA